MSINACLSSERMDWLTPPDTRWFRHALEHASAICFWSGRIRFFGATAGAPFPSVFLYLHPLGLTRSFREAFKPHGVVAGASSGWRDA